MKAEVFGNGAIDEITFFLSNNRTFMVGERDHSNSKPEYKFTFEEPGHHICSLLLFNGAKDILKGQAANLAVSFERNSFESSMLQDFNKNSSIKNFQYKKRGVIAKLKKVYLLNKFFC